MTYEDALAGAWGARNAIDNQAETMYCERWHAAKRLRAFEQRKADRSCDELVTVAHEGNNHMEHLWDGKSVAKARGYVQVVNVGAATANFTTQNPKPHTEVISLEKFLAEYEPMAIVPLDCVATKELPPVRVGKWDGKSATKTAMPAPNFLRDNPNVYDDYEIELAKQVADEATRIAQAEAAIYRIGKWDVV